MAFADAQNTTLHDCSFTDIRGDQNNSTIAYHHGPVSIHNGPLITTYELEGNTLNKGVSGIAALYNASSPNAAHNSLERDPPPRCHLGTRTIELQNIANWHAAAAIGRDWNKLAENGLKGSLRQSKQQAASILWLYGPVGAGKTAIAQTVAET